MSYEIINYNARRGINYGERLLAGYALNDLRSYLFPLYTPKGALVLQEAPPDHPHHQGLWCGLEVDGHDLWNAGSFGKVHHAQVNLQSLNTINTTITAAGVDFASPLRWCKATGETILHEARTIHIAAHQSFTHVQWQSTFSHQGKVTQLGQTKEAGIAIRVPPHWETIFGGRIRNAQGGRGEAETFDRSSPWINVEGRVVGETYAGIVLAAGIDSEPRPWFTRDYGIHVYNPTRHRAIILAPGETVTWSVDVLAYDGTQTIEQINAWVDSLS